MFDIRIMQQKSSFLFWTIPPVIVIAVGVAVYWYAGREAGSGETQPPETSAELLPPPPLPPLHSGKEKVVSAAPAMPPEAETAGGRDTSPKHAFGDLSSALRALPGLVGALSNRPELVLWLKNDHLIHHFVYAVDCVANEYSPAEQISFLKPPDAFSVEEKEGECQPASASHTRYDVIADVFCSLDDKGAADAYRRLEPFFDTVYREQCQGTAPFRSALTTAAGVLLATPVPDRLPTLTRIGPVYVYRDARFERLSAPQKHLLRMGPKNARRVQAKIRELADELALKLP